MLEDWKGKLLLLVMVAAAILAVVLGMQNGRLKRDLDSARGGLTACQEGNHNLQAEFNQATSELTSLRSDYSALQNELEQLKARRGGTKKTARTP